jgi:orotate phosphoribosyltransferase
MQFPVGFGPVGRDFLDERNAISERFLEFLHDYRCDILLPRGFAPKRALERPETEEQRVLGLHRFKTESEVNDYVMRWQQNPSLRLSGIQNHRFFLSRAVDLLCSELLSNAFDHSGPRRTERDVFILAQLVGTRSYERDLALDRQHGHLTTTERNVYRRALARGTPLLQIAIGDMGWGFRGNHGLVAKYISEFGKQSKPTDEQLMRYALRGDVTTREPKSIAEAWQQMANAPDTYRPRVHGLSEVAKYVSRLGGCWRMHSGTTALTIDASGDEFEIARPETLESLRQVRGCLHLLSIPLPAQLKGGARATPRRSLVAQRVQVYDIAEVIANNRSLGEQVNGVRLWKELSSYLSQNDQSAPVVLTVYCLDRVDEQSMIYACALLSDLISRWHRETPLYVCGASEVVRSQLCRFSMLDAFLRDDTIIPFISPEQVFSDELVDIECAAKYGLLKPMLRKLLLGNPDRELLRSELSAQPYGDTQGSYWDELCRVVDANPAHFVIRPIASDLGVKARFTVEQLDYALGNVLRGGRNFVDFKKDLIGSRGVARLPEGGGGYWRLGLNVDGYVHLGRIFAHESTRSDIARCFAVGIQAHKATAEVIAKRAENLVFVGVLHPGIDLAQELVAQELFRPAGIIEIRRMAEVRWDSSPVAQASGKDVIIVTDLVRSGRTMRELIAALRYVGAKVHIVAAVLAVDRLAESGVQVIAFSYTDEKSYKAMIAEAPVLEVE